MALNLVPFVSVDKMMKLVLQLGIERVMRDLVAEIEADSAAGRCSTRPPHRLAFRCRGDRTDAHLTARPTASNM